MKRILIFLLAYFSSVNGYAEAASAKTDVAQKAKLIIFRERFSPPLNYKPLININSIKAFYLPRGHHAELELAPGKYNVLADWKVLHGVRDSSIDIELSAGEIKYLDLGTSLTAVLIGGVVGMSMGGGLEDGNSNSVDLSDSRKVSRWHANWKYSGFSGERTETMNERYELTLNVEKLLTDLSVGDPKKKMKIFRFLLSRKIYEDEILIAFEDEILSSYESPGLARGDIVFLAHACRYLASSQNRDFVPTLEKVRVNTVNKKLNKYARNFLKDYYGLEYDK